MRGGPGEDELYGGTGDDSMSGDEGADEMRGGADSDFLFATVFTEEQPDVVDGGDGFDQCIVDANDTVRNCERTETIIP
jgi:Ca2+-binding RTX toxin-like protein